MVRVRDCGRLNRETRERVGAPSCDGAPTGMRQAQGSGVGGFSSAFGV